MTVEDCNVQIRIARLAWRNGELSTKDYLLVRSYWIHEKGELLWFRRSEEIWEDNMSVRCI